jgi:hypothetical protein
MSLVAHVVGNGDMLAAQEQSLTSPNRGGQLWGFNDLKGMPDGLMPDVLVRRFHHGVYPEPKGIEGHPRRVLLVEGPCAYEPGHCLHVQNLTLFPGCNATDEEFVQEVRDKPSTGMIVLGLLDPDTNVSRIDVYAMNFQFQYGLAHSAHEKDVATKCCKKCHFHKTWSTFYFPVRKLDHRWLLQFMGMYLIPLVIGGTSSLLFCFAVGLGRYLHGRRRTRGVGMCKGAPLGSGVRARCLSEDEAVPLGQDPRRPSGPPRLDWV